MVVNSYLSHLFDRVMNEGFGSGLSDLVGPGMSVCLSRCSLSAVMNVCYVDQGGRRGKNGLTR